MTITSGSVAWARHDDTLRLTRISTSEEPPSSPRTVLPQPALPDPTRPTKLTIPAIGVSTSLVSLALNRDGTVQVPSDPAKAGWYRLGPTPGSPGSAVILGHVDSSNGPAVFYLLRTLTPGARIDVTLLDRSVVRFAVRTIKTYANNRFPAAHVYRNRGPATLTLVTCGGRYDESKGGYQANVVVSAAEVGRDETPPTPK